MNTGNQNKKEARMHKNKVRSHGGTTLTGFKKIDESMMMAGILFMASMFNKKR